MAGRGPGRIISAPCSLEAWAWKVPLLQNSTRKVAEEALCTVSLSLRWGAPAVGPVGYVDMGTEVPTGLGTAVGVPRKIGKPWRESMTR
jgi:hypothetical protein